MWKQKQRFRNRIMKYIKYLLKGFLSRKVKIDDKSIIKMCIVHILDQYINRNAGLKLSLYIYYTYNYNIYIHAYTLYKDKYKTRWPNH